MTLDFIPSLLDRYVWMRIRDDDTWDIYIYTCIDCFEVNVNESIMCVNRITVDFLVKEHCPLHNYLGNNNTHNERQYICTYSVQAYTIETKSKAERSYGCLPKESSPIHITECHSESDACILQDLDDYRKLRIIL